MIAKQGLRTLTSPQMLSLLATPLTLLIRKKNKYKEVGFMASMYQNLPSNRCCVQNSVLDRTVPGYAYQKHFIFGEHEMKSFSP